MKIDVFTIFPEMLSSYLSWSLIGRARAQGLIDISVHDIRSFSGDTRRSVDGKPFGGGAGMVMLPEPVFEAVEGSRCTRPLFLLAPSGKVFDQAMATEMANLGSSTDGGFSLLCGRYEGVDQRVADYLADGEISVGDYVISGGELAALIVIEATCRLVPGVMGNDASVTEESFNDGLLEYPQYSHPRSFRGWEVPPVLLSGDHRRIASWRKAWQLKLTIERRPDLIEARGGVTPEEREMITLLDSGLFNQ